MKEERAFYTGLLKLHLALVIVASLVSILLGLRLDEAQLDHPLLMFTYSVWDKLLLLAYNFSLLVLCFYPLILIVLLMSAFLALHHKWKRILNLEKVLFQGNGVLCAGAMVAVFLGLVLANKILGTVPAYSIFGIHLIVLILIFLRYFFLQESGDDQDILSSTVVSFASTVISLNLFNIMNESENLSWVLVVMMIFIWAFLTLGSYFCVCLYLRVFRRGEDRHDGRVLASTKRALLGVFPLAVVLSGVGFVLENSETAISFREIHSDTRQDMNVILVVIDAVRADHVGAYGYRQPTTPHLDSFAKEGTMFKNCYAQSSWTKPSIASLFTSLYPPTHGAIIHGSVLSDEATTLAEILQREGYVTYGYTANPNVKKIFNFQQGFDFYDDYAIRDKLYLVALRSLPVFHRMIKSLTGRSFDHIDRDNARYSNDRILPWLRRYKNENFFVYLHYMDPHYPYTPPERYREMFSYTSDKDNILWLMGSYDGEIRFADEQFGILMEELKSLGIYDKSLIVVMSDHGESFDDHGHILHGSNIYEEQIKVPLIMKFSGHIPPNNVVESQVRVIDVMPSILDFAGIPPKSEMEGISLRPLLNNATEEGLIGDIYVDENLFNDYILQGIIIGKKWKYIFTEKSVLVPDGMEELFNLRRDPEELDNLIDRDLEVRKLLREKLSFYRNYSQSKKIGGTEIELDEETVRQLKSLGYLGIEQ